MKARQIPAFLALAFLLAWPLVASAQQNDLPPASAASGLTEEPLLGPDHAPAVRNPETLPYGEESEKAIAPEDIPEILMAEMAEIEKNCAANAMYSSFHDCRCIAVKFLDARIKSDPERSRDNVFTSVSSQCPNPPGIAGYIYKSCADVMKGERPRDFDRLCSCAANHVAKAYSETPVMNMRYIDSLRKRALIDCGIGRNPAYNSPYLNK